LDVGLRVLAAASISGFGVPLLQRLIEKE
jgi:hypothetical protein